MQRAPKIIRWEAFSEISYSELQSLRECLFKSLSRNLRLDYPMPEVLPSKSGLLGKFHHMTMELIQNSSSLSELEREIEAQIRALQVEVDKWPHLKSGAVSGWAEINFYATAALREYRRKSKAAGNIIAASEKRLYSKDKLLLGKPDNFYIVDRTAHLQEFKTGNLKAADGSVRPEYIEQLKFYSLLLFDNFSLELVEASLISPYGEPYTCQFSKEQIEEFRSEILALIAEKNSKLNSVQQIILLTNAGKDNCSSCNKRPICPSFLKEQFDLELDYETYVFKGILESISKTQSNGAYLVKLRKAGREDFFEFLLPLGIAEELRIGNAYVFIDMNYRNGVPQWNHKSRVLVDD